MKQWYELKPRERDALLIQIRNSLDSGVQPILEDAALFEQLVLTYHDDYEKNDAGLRKRSETKPTTQLLDKTESELHLQSMEIATSLIQRKMPPEALRVDMASRINAYVNREISAAKLLGVLRDIKLSDQLKYFMGALAHEAHKCINRDPHAPHTNRIQSVKLSFQKISGSAEEHRSNNLFCFLVDLSKKHQTVDAIAAFYRIEERDKPSIAFLRDEIAEEIDVMPDEHYLDLLSPNAWAQCYYDWRKRFL